MGKHIAILAIFLTLILGGSGCMEKQQDFKTIALNYMEEKYGETFSYVSPWGSSSEQHGTKKIMVQCGSLPGDILVQGIPDGDGYIFSDNYLAVKYRQEMSNAIQSVADGVFDASRVFYEVQTQTLSADLPADASFDAYSRDAQTRAFAAVAVPESAFDQSLLERFAGDLHDTGIRATIRFLSLGDAEYEALSTEMLESTIGQRQYRYFTVILADEKGIRISPGEVG